MHFVRGISDSESFHVCGIRSDVPYFAIITGFKSR